MTRPVLLTTLLLGCLVLGAAVTLLGRGSGPTDAGIVRVAFPAEEPVFRVTLERDAAGRVVLRRALEDRAEARVVDGRAALRVEADGLWVLPTDRRIEVEVRVPTSVEEVLLLLPGRDPRTVSLATLGTVGSGTLRLPLSYP